MKRVYLALSCGVIALGLVHMAATARFFAALTQSALWFLSGGLVMVLTGALNLLNRSYGAVAPGLRWVSVAANVVMTLFALTTGLVGRASAVELVVIVGLLVSATVMSALPHAVIAPSASGAA
jgi:hypothetical protein